MEKGHNSASVMDTSALVGQKELARGEKLKGYSQLERKVMCQLSIESL